MGGGQLRVQVKVHRLSRETHGAILLGAHAARGEDHHKEEEKGGEETHHGCCFSREVVTASKCGDVWVLGAVRPETDLLSECVFGSSTDGIRKRGKRKKGERNRKKIEKKESWRKEGRKERKNEKKQRKKERRGGK